MLQFDDLSIEIKLKILSYLPINSLLSIGSTSHTNKELLDCDWFWVQMLQDDFDITCKSHENPKQRYQKCIRTAFFENLTKDNYWQNLHIHPKQRPFIIKKVGDKLIENSQDLEEVLNYLLKNGHNDFADQLVEQLAKNGFFINFRIFCKFAKNFRYKYSELIRKLAENTIENSLEIIGVSSTFCNALELFNKIGFFDLAEKLVRSLVTDEEFRSKIAPDAYAFCDIMEDLLNPNYNKKYNDIVKKFTDQLVKNEKFRDGLIEDDNDSHRISAFLQNYYCTNPNPEYLWLYSPPDPAQQPFNISEKPHEQEETESILLQRAIWESIQNPEESGKLTKKLMDDNIKLFKQQEELKTASDGNNSPDNYIDEFDFWSNEDEFEDDDLCCSGDEFDEDSYSTDDDLNGPGMT